MKTILCVVLAASLALAAIPAGKDLTGKWTFNVETGAGNGTPTFNFKQDGDKLTGDYTGQLGNNKITGTCKDGKFEFKFTVDQIGDVVYTGEILENGNVKGKVKLGEMGDGTFTGERAK